MPDLEKFWKDRWAAHEKTGTSYSTNKTWNPKETAEETRFLEGKIEALVRMPTWRKTVLDYGCGEARFLSLWRALGFVYVGADILDAMLLQNAHRWNETFLHVDKLESFPAPHILFFSMVLQHLEDAKISTVLTTIRSPNILVIDNSQEGGPPYVRYRTDEQLRGILVDAGWRDIRVERAETTRATYKILAGYDRPD
jgi:SAM-dependent methyltransferase